MAIHDFVLPTLEVTLPGGASFAVRGLSLQDVTLLISQHGPVLEEFFNKYSNEADAMQVGLGLLGKAPDLAAAIISLAADEPGEARKILRLPIAVQQDALEKIAHLTFEASGGPGKFVEAVMRLISGTTNLMGGRQLR